jgi:hypothetical protein
MEAFSKEEIEKRKRAVFEAMSSRGQKRIERIGYDKWDPFMEPKDPIDIRTEKTNRTAKSLMREFLQTTTADTYSNAYGQGVLDICLGIVNDDDRYLGMFEFSVWYAELLRKEGQKPPQNSGADSKEDHENL